MTCTECGAEVVQPATGRRRKTCSPFCARTRDHRLNRLRSKRFWQAVKVSGGDRDPRASLEALKVCAIRYAAAVRCGWNERATESALERLKRAAERYRRAWRQQVRRKSEAA